ncbi:hypothetical protein [Pseudooceanicola algae]|uniref:Uncharacterized protein n=1 Tax=Pseudooceanicola algae TaxID=1537215 RepID=A0A418SKJ2_9RHOB|nr:hypothetical protein [Pseudooceanicola algae]QPM90743.1 hypothetical protein PSAL_019820 [Pseudooceanicola algae]
MSDFSEDSGGAVVSDFEEDIVSARLGVRSTLRKQTAEGLVFGFAEVTYGHAFDPSDLTVPVVPSSGGDLISALDENTFLARLAIGAELDNGMTALQRATCFPPPRTSSRRGRRSVFCPSHAQKPA